MRVRSTAAAEAKKTEAAAKTDSADEPIATALKMDDLKVELGYALLPLVNAPDGSDRLTEQIKALRRSLAVEIGFLMPAVRILDNVQLDANAYVIKVKEVEAGSGKVWAGQYMVMDPAGGQVKLPGTHTTEPTFGLPATWIDGSLKEDASIPDHGLWHSARAAEPAGRTRVDPRSRDNPRRHCGWHRRLAQSGHIDRARARTSVASALRAIHQPKRLSAVDRAVSEVGAGVC